MSITKVAKLKIQSPDWGEVFINYEGQTYVVQISPTHISLSKEKGVDTADFRCMFRKRINKKNKRNA
jgi:NADPH-dependent 7-cyano-7-deazaguanine reductase QueF